MTYMYVRKNLTFIEDPQEQSLLVAFLTALYDPVYIGQCSSLGFTAVGDAIKNLGLGGIELLSTTGSKWTFENSTTKPLEGQGNFVISQKRRTYAELQRSELMSDVQSLMILVQAMNDQILILQNTSQVAGTSAPPTTTAPSYLADPSATPALTPAANPTPTSTATPVSTRTATPVPTPTTNTDSLEALIARVEDDLFTDDNARQLRAALALSAISFTLWGITILGFIVKFFCFRGGSMVEYSSGSGV
jgi:hypothetical protein